MNETEGLTHNEHIQIDGTIEALLTDLKRRLQAGELMSFEFIAADKNGNTLTGQSTCCGGY